MALKKHCLIPFLMATLLVFPCASIQAASETYNKVSLTGTVELVDPAQKTFTIKKEQGGSITIATTPATEFEIESDDKPLVATPGEASDGTSGGLSGRGDADASFNGLKIGDRVKVKCYHPDALGNAYGAKTVNIYR